MSMQRLLLLPTLTNLSLNFTSFRENQVPKDSGVERYRKILEMEELGAMQPNLSPCSGDQVSSGFLETQVTNRRGTSELAGVVDNKLTQFLRL